MPSESDSPQTVGMPHMMTLAREWLRAENARMAASGEAADPRHVTRIVGWLLAEVQRLRLRVCDRISHLGEEEDSPVAWAANIPGKYGAAPTMLFGYTENLVRSIAAAGGDSVAPFPLYRQPQATLTDEERKAIAWFAEAGKPLAILTQSHNREQYRATLRGLLERTLAHAQASDLPPTLTDAEREAMEFFADLPWARESDNAVEARLIRGFLDRVTPTNT